MRFKQKIAATKTFVSAWFWALSNCKLSLRNSSTCWQIEADNLNFSPYLPGLLADFEKSNWSVCIQDRHMITMLYQQRKNWVSLPRIDFTLAASANRIAFFAKTKERTTNKLVLPYYFDHVDLAQDRSVLLPFVMHPSNYKRGIPETQVADSRKIRVFFSGNTSKAAYDLTALKQSFGVLSRWQIREIILDKFKAKTQLTSSLPENGKDIWWIDWQWNPGQHHGPENRISGDQWFTHLLSSDFFIACPGVNMPLCHNLIEAMACGCVPIIQFPELLPEPLEHQINCLAFSDEKSLVRLIEESLEMSDTEIKKMRLAVLDYYRKHLHPSVIKLQLTDRQAKTLFFPVNVLSTSRS